MNLFSIVAYATDGAAPVDPAAGNPMIAQLLFPVLILVVFYLVLILPQRKKDKRMKAMISALRVGDEIVTIGGIFGKVSAIKDETLVIESGADKCKVRIARWGVKECLTVHDDKA